VPRFTLYGSPHSLPTYKVALLLRLSGEPFSFRYVSFQRNEHRKPEFLVLSRWGQVPVLVEDGHTYLQATAIIEHLAATLRRFEGSNAAARQAVREWLYWEVDVLFPPIFNCYGVELGRRGLLPIAVAPEIADYHRRRAEAALGVLDSHLAPGRFLCDSQPTIADIACCADHAFARMSEIDLGKWQNIAAWAARMTALPGFALPLELLPMADAEFAGSPERA
jgi:glutathione S-transferase